MYAHNPILRCKMSQGKYLLSLLDIHKFFRIGCCKYCTAQKIFVNIFCRLFSMLQKNARAEKWHLVEIFCTEMLLSLIFFLKDARNMEKGNQKINVAQGIALRRAFKTDVTFAGCFRRKFMFLWVVYSLGRSLLKKISGRFASIKSPKNAIMDKESCWSIARSAFAERCQSWKIVGGISKINWRKMVI